MRRIAIYTGSRADSSPLIPLIVAFKGDANTRIIETRGLYGHEENIKTQLLSWSPDILVILGDRYENLIAASVATVLCIPIAHLSGGDITIGANDDSFRHAITKLAYWHFPISEIARERVVRMGEDPARVYNYGAVAVDNLVGLMGKRELENETDIQTKYGLFTFAWHPETLGDSRVEEILEAFEVFPDFDIACCSSNLDEGGADITRKIEAWANNRPNTFYKPDWPNKVWNSIICHSSVCVGNSSAFMIEAPTMGTPTINIGTRQAGRLRTPGILDVHCSASAIKHAINSVLNLPRCHPSRVFGYPGRVAPSIAKVLLSVAIPSKPVKRFFE